MWLISFITEIICIISLYYSMQLKNLRLKIPAIIAFSLLLMGETIDLLADIALNTLLAIFTELLELFVTIGFFTLIYYTYINRIKKKRRRGSRK